MIGFPKFPTGVSAKEARHARKQERKQEADAIKRDAKARDGFQCRWPHCEFRHTTTVIEAAHVQAAGMGGDPKQIRTIRDNLIAVCDLHHQRAPLNMHNGGLKIEPLTTDGTDGPCAFYRWDVSRNDYFMVAQEIEPRVLSRD